MELILIQPNSVEWDYMWTWLENHPVNKGLDEPSIALNNNEAWQYMGSYKQGDRVIHELRHRDHPVTNSIQNLKLQASELFTKDQIQKTFKQ
jgi:hypothetical protein